MLAATRLRPFFFVLFAFLFAGISTALAAPPIDVVVPDGLMAIAISPGDVTVTNGQVVDFNATGGTGTGYRFTLTRNDSNGSINALTGEYVAGPNSATDAVRVTDSAGNVANAIVRVVDATGDDDDDDTGPGPLNLSVTPTVATTSPRGILNFAARGGTPGYVFALQTNASGGRVATNGQYTAGTRGNVVDRIRVTDARGQSVTASINVGAPITVTPPSASIPARGTVTLTARGGSGVGYTWTASAGSVKTTGATVTFTAPATKSSVKITVKDSLQNQAQVNVAVGGAIAITPPTLVTQPKGRVRFTAVGGDGVTFRWSIALPSRGATINPTTGEFVAGQEGNVAESVIVTDALGNTATATVTVGVGLSISPSNVSVAANGQVPFAAAGGSGQGYVFSVESNASGASVGANGSYTAGAGAGTDIVKVVDSNGNEARSTVVVTGGGGDPNDPNDPSFVGSTDPTAGFGRSVVGGVEDECAVSNVGAISSRLPLAAFGAVLFGLLLAVRRRRRA